MSPEYNQKRNARLAYADYFHAVRDSVVSGLFDIISHMEYANRRGIAAWGSYNTRAHMSDLNTIFDRMIDEEMTLEINTGGLHHGVDVTYPCTDTVELYVQRGGRHISFGSDAHHPDQLAHGYAHGQEAPVDANGASFAAGFVLASTSLHLAGLAGAWAVRRMGEPRLGRAAGLGVALGGLALAWLG